MNNNIRILSIAAFVAAIPSLIITDWYYKGFGVLAMFVMLTIGLVLDQVKRLKDMEESTTTHNRYMTNRILNIIALVLFVQSPVALIYGNKLCTNLGFWLLIAMICIGITLNQIARIKFSYEMKGDE